MVVCLPQGWAFVVGYFSCVMFFLAQSLKLAQYLHKVLAQYLRLAQYLHKVLAQYLKLAQYCKVVPSRVECFADSATEIVA